MSSNYEPSIYKHKKKEREVQQPKYYCCDCKKRCENRCTFYDRPIIVNLNRCFNHSYYSPITALFKAKEDLEEVIKEQQHKRKRA